MSKYRSNYDLMLPQKAEEDFRRCLYINERSGFRLKGGRVIAFKKLPDQYLVAWFNKAGRLADLSYNLTIQELEFDILAQTGSMRALARKTLEIVRPRSPREHFMMSHVQAPYMIAEAMDRRLSVIKSWIPIFCHCLEAKPTPSEVHRRNEVLREAAAQSLGAALGATILASLFDTNMGSTRKPKGPTLH